MFGVQFYMTINSIYCSHVLPCIQHMYLHKLYSSESLPCVEMLSPFMGGLHMLSFKEKLGNIWDLSEIK